MVAWLLSNEAVCVAIVDEVTLKDRRPTLAALEEARVFTSILSLSSFHINRKGVEYSPFEADTKVREMDRS